jgi:membrane protease YdiL (CAAX protease family)
MAFPSVMTWLYFVALASGPSAAPSGPRPGVNLALMAAFAVGKLVQFGFPLFCLVLVEGKRPRLSGPRLRGLALGVAFGVLVSAGIGLAYQLALHDYLVKIGTPAKIRVKVADAGLDTPAGYLLLAAFYCLVHSLLEEYYWRWFVFGRLRRLVPFGVALALANLAFMGHHIIVLVGYLPGTKQFFTAVLPLSLGVAAGGVVWSWLYDRTESLYAPWVSHLLIDAAIMAVGYDLLFG